MEIAILRAQVEQQGISRNDRINISTEKTDYLGDFESIYEGRPKTQRYPTGEDVGPSIDIPVLILRLSDRIEHIPIDNIVSIVRMS